MWWNTLLLSLREIRRNLLRSFLTILGIVIGVSAVVTMVTLGRGATQAVQTQIASMGSNLLMVSPGQRLGPGAGGAGAPSFKESDGEAIATQIGGVARVAPEVRQSVTVVADGRNWQTTVTGSTGDYLAVKGWVLAGGRNFEPAELQAGAAVCLVGQTVKRELYGSRNPLGQMLRVKQFSCSIV
ncbi:MAG: multidrug ABC transporter substrate-binding protein, partial [Burkholderiales bacterium PBB5]